MSELDEKLNSILSNPAMMQQIMSIAQSLNQSEQGKSQQPPQQVTPPVQQSADAFSDHGLNPNLLSKIASIMQRGSIDKNQESLLKALRPYLSRQKLEKLEVIYQTGMLTESEYKATKAASEMVNTRGQSPFSRR